MTPEEIKDADFKKKNINGKFPLLELADGKTLSESVAIAKYIARVNAGSKLLGKDEFENDQIDQWTDFVNSTIIKNLYGAVGPIFGHPGQADAWAEAIKNIKDAIRVLNNHMTGRAFFVGDTVTIADIAVVTALALPMQLILDAGFRKGHAAISTWWEKFSREANVVKRMGNVVACVKTIKPLFPKKDEAKKDAPKAAAAKPAEEKKKEGDPLDELAPSTFVLNDFKDFFLNCGDKAGAGMKHFFEKYDNAGYCIYFVHYDKVEGEGDKLFLMQNMMNGFLQRIDHFRKHTFSMTTILGDEPNLDIEGVWMFRGKGIPAQMIEHPQFEYYDKKELDVSKPEDRKLITDFWCAKADESVINGKKVRDCKTHK